MIKITSIFVTTTLLLYENFFRGEDVLHSVKMFRIPVKNIEKVSNTAESWSNKLKIIEVFREGDPL